MVLVEIVGYCLFWMKDGDLRKQFFSKDSKKFSFYLCFLWNTFGFMWIYYCFYLIFNRSSFPQVWWGFVFVFLCLFFLGGKLSFYEQCFIP